jgi:hypothetical protein
MSPPTAAHHSFACKLLVTLSVGGGKKEKKSSGLNYYCFVCWPDWKTWVAFEICMLPLLAFV